MRHHHRRLPFPFGGGGGSGGKSGGAASGITYKFLSVWYQYVIPACVVLWIISTIAARNTISVGGSGLPLVRDEPQIRGNLRGGRGDMVWVRSDSQAFVSFIAFHLEFITD